MRISAPKTLINKSAVRHRHRFPIEDGSLPGYAKQRANIKEEWGSKREKQRALTVVKQSCATFVSLAAILPRRSPSDSGLRDESGQVGGLIRTGKLTHY